MSTQPNSQAITKRGGAQEFSDNAPALPAIAMHDAIFQSYSSLHLIGLVQLMELTDGLQEIVIGVLDGPVDTAHPDLCRDSIRVLHNELDHTYTEGSRSASAHGTFIAGILCGKRGSVATSICPRCSLLIRPLFRAYSDGRAGASAKDLAEAIFDAIDAGANILNMGLTVLNATALGVRHIQEALDYAIARGVIVVAAAGNQGIIGSTAITRHPAVIPVAASDLQGRPLDYSNLGNSIGRKGFLAPGTDIQGLGIGGATFVSRGTSVSAAFISGGLALLWSSFPQLSTTELRLAIAEVYAGRHLAIVPPLFNAWSVYQFLRGIHGRR